MMRPMAATIFLLLGSLLDAACACGRPSSPCGAYADAPAVFVCRVRHPARV